MVLIWRYIKRCLLLVAWVLVPLVAAAAVMAINELFKRPLQKRELLPFAVLGEQAADGAYHADNVGPSLLGGIALIRGGRALDFSTGALPFRAAFSYSSS